MKRSLDIILVIPLLIVCLPVLGLIGMWVWLVMGWPVIFCQDRPGYRGRIFKIYKFRTMKELRDKQGKVLPDSERLTPLGRFLRQASLDELPELFNVLIGDMSLVGPRPLLPQYLGRYSPEQARRHEVLPGITGWAQVKGRNAISWEDKFKLDTWYVDNRDLILDLKIMFLTIARIFSREGINQPGQATAQEFKGKG
jgi:sugar transferase EpsL